MSNLTAGDNPPPEDWGVQYKKEVERLDGFFDLGGDDAESASADPFALVASDEAATEAPAVALKVNDEEASGVRLGAHSMLTTGAMGALADGFGLAVEIARRNGTLPEKKWWQRRRR